MKKNGAICSQCGRSCPAGECSEVDGECVCRECLFGETVPLCFHPIGAVLNDQHMEGLFGVDKKGVSQLVLHPGMARFMSGVEEESHLTVVWYVHRPGPLVTGFQRRWDGKRVGPFAARTPNRPNGIAITEVEVLGRKDNVLFVQGLDAIDGTPILDIKASMESLRRTPKKPLRD
ncbi:TrmO family methyltransferase domain-containing protein [Desulfoplanes sp.]